MLNLSLFDIGVLQFQDSPLNRDRISLREDLLLNGCWLWMFDDLSSLLKAVIFLAVVQYRVLDLEALGIILLGLSQH